MPLPPDFPGSAESKRLRDHSTGSAHFNGVTNLTDKSHESGGLQRQAGETGDAKSPKERVAEAHVLVKNLIFW